MRKLTPLLALLLLAGATMPNFNKIETAIEEVEQATGLDCRWDAKVCDAQGLQSLTIRCGGPNITTDVTDDYILQMDDIYLQMDGDGNGSWVVQP